MKNSYGYRFLISGIFFLLVLGGCGSTQPSRFYTLDSVGNHEVGNQSVPADYNISVSIGPVDIPDYLDRPQIVSRTSQNELSLSEFDRWAGSLKDDIVRVLSENLTNLLSQNSVFVSPWGRGIVSDYQVTINIRRFDAMPEGNVLLNAQWTIIGKEGTQILRMRESFITESMSAQTYSAKVSAMSGALEKLSRDIAEEIKAVSKKNT
jgi:uncharacterized lipoprotein YmbA